MQEKQAEDIEIPNISWKVFEAMMRCVTLRHILVRVVEGVPLSRLYWTTLLEQGTLPTISKSTKLIFEKAWSSDVRRARVLTRALFKQTYGWFSHV